MGSARRKRKLIGEGGWAVSSNFGEFCGGLLRGVLIVIVSVALTTGFLLAMGKLNSTCAESVSANPPAQPQELTITRYYSDVDGREISDPLIQHYDGEKLREYRGTVIVRYLDGDKWLVRVLFRELVIQQDGSGREELVDRVEWIVKEKVEVQVYFDPNGKAETVGAIRS